MKNRAGNLGRRRSPGTGCARAEGFLLLDAMMTLAILTIGILGVLFAFQANFRASRDIGAQDIASSAIENAVDTLETANFNTLYTAFQGVRMPVPELVGPNGGPASVLIQFDVNETALPPGYGPIEDIDGDGMSATANAAATYVLLPARLTLNYVMSYGPDTRELYLVLAPH